MIQIGCSRVFLQRMLSQETTEKLHVLNNQGLELACCLPATELVDELVRIVHIHSGVTSSSGEEHSPGVCRKMDSTGGLCVK